MKCFDCSRKLCKQVLYAATDILLLLTMELDGDTGVLKAEDEGKGEQKSRSQSLQTLFLMAMETDPNFSLYARVL
jgi:hypothetical protein